MDALVENRIWIQAAHVVFVIAWMAGMLYLPRLYVYHAQSAPGSTQSETFKVMERKLLRGIVNPAMTLTLITGLLLVATRDSVAQEGWFWVKVAGLVGLFTLHGFYARWRRHFAADANRHRHTFYRWMNEAPAVLMVLIVLMAVAKPF